MTTKTAAKRVRVSQEDVPAYSLTEALRVATALHDNFGKDSAPPLRVAGAMEMSPSSSTFKMLTGAAIAYGLTSGGYNATAMGLLPLASRILKPKEEGEDIAAKREAFLKPKIIGDFLRKYNGSPLPKGDIAKNVLEDMGVPNERSERTFNLIVEGAKELALMPEIKGKFYIDLTGTSKTETVLSENEESVPKRENSTTSNLPPTNVVVPPIVGAMSNRKVFITHGKNRAFVEPIKKLLIFGELEAVVSVEKQSVSQPVPDKVMSDMRSCAAAIIHVEDELKLMDAEAKEHIMLNPNVLIEIGAAMALFGRRFILLVKEGVRLPSNLQGLFEVRYTGDALDGTATIKLLEAINELKKVQAN